MLWAHSPELYFSVRCFIAICKLLAQTIRSLAFVACIWYRLDSGENMRRGLVHARSQAVLRCLRQRQGATSVQLNFLEARLQDMTAELMALDDKLEESKKEWANDLFHAVGESLKKHCKGKGKSDAMRSACEIDAKWELSEFAIEKIRWYCNADFADFKDFVWRHFDQAKMYFDGELKRIDKVMRDSVGEDTVKSLIGEAQEEAKQKHSHERVSKENVQQLMENTMRQLLLDEKKQLDEALSEQSKFWRSEVACLQLKFDELEKEHRRASQVRRNGTVAVSDVEHQITDAVKELEAKVSSQITTSRRELSEELQKAEEQLQATHTCFDHVTRGELKSVIGCELELHLAGMNDNLEERLFRQHKALRRRIDSKIRLAIHGNRVCTLEGKVQQMQVDDVAYVNRLDMLEGQFDALQQRFHQLECAGLPCTDSESSDCEVSPQLPAYYAFSSFDQYIPCDPTHFLSDNAMCG